MIDRRERIVLRDFVDWAYPLSFTHNTTLTLYDRTTMDKPSAV